VLVMPRGCRTPVASRLRPSCVESLVIGASCAPATPLRYRVHPVLHPVMGKRNPRGVGAAGCPTENTTPDGRWPLDVSPQLVLNKSSGGPGPSVKDRERPSMKYLLRVHVVSACPGQDHPVSTSSSRGRRRRPAARVRPLP
jgi:hypothetical protein